MLQRRYLKRQWGPLAAAAWGAPPAGVKPEDRTHEHVVEWSAPDGRVLHQHLADEATNLRKQADELDRQAKLVIDTVVTPSTATDEQVWAAIDAKRPGIEQTLGLG